MKDQNQQIPTVNPLPIPSAPEAPKTESPVIAKLKNIWAKVYPKIKPFWDKFYSNKKIFILIVSLFGVMLLIIILGLLFGKRGGTTVQTAKASPTPDVVQATPSPTPTGDAITNDENKLIDLNKQINALDIKQSHLQPPVVNFDIKF